MGKFAGILMIFFLLQCGPSSVQKNLQEKALTLFGVLPDSMPGMEEDTPALEDLGKKLFIEKRLSEKGNISCNSCHTVTDRKGGTGSEKTAGLKKRNVPTVLNAGYYSSYYWDGKFKELQKQILSHIQEEMGIGPASLESRLSPEYLDLIAKALPSNTKLNLEYIALSLSAYLHTLKTKDRFDDFVKGNFKALSFEEISGMETFIAVGCSDCHSTYLLGGGFRKMGEKNPYKNISDLGRFTVTNEEQDKMIFRVPSLRNIALRGSYFHDGSTADLEDAISEMAFLQLNKRLSDRDIQKIAVFLKALTDKDRER